MTAPFRATPSSTDRHGDSPLELFESQRRRLFAIAYRMLGTVEDAEDLVQETFLRWHSADHDGIENPGAWLSTVVTRLSLKQLQLSHRHREVYVGPWLPEPLPTSWARTRDAAEVADSISIAFLTLMERLSPRERAVFLLREVFDYEFGEIAKILSLGTANCRQLLHRAKLRLGKSVRRFRPDPQVHRQLINRFASAIRNGNIDEVIELLVANATLCIDSGGAVRAAARRPLRGARAIAQFLVGVTRKVAPPDLRIYALEINGEPALVNAVNGHPQQVVTIAIEGGRISAINIIANPVKLRRVARDLAALPAEACVTT